MKKLKSALMVTLALLLITTAESNAQEWTKAQKEVWQVVEKSWADWKNKDESVINTLFHDKYQGWNLEDPLPSDKKDVQASFMEMKEMFDLNYYVIRPARIAVTENAAVVDYYYSMYYTRKDGEKKKTDKEKGKYVEFYVKEGGSWKLLGDMTAPDPAKEKNDDMD